MSGRPRLRLSWRLLVDSPLVVATWVSLVLGLLALVQVARSLRDADRVCHRAGQILAHVAAEAAVASVAENGVPVDEEILVGRVPVRVQVLDQTLQLVASPPGDRAWRFFCRRLSGEAPAELGRAFTGAAGLAPFLPPGTPCTGPASVELDPEALAEAWSASRATAFSRDVGIGLLHFAAGTDLDDFVADPNVPRLGLPRDADLVVVPGHLWIQSGEAPWRLWLDHDLTVVVQGNLYVGRSIEVDGPGRLVLVTVPSPRAVAFADADGDGRWSPGESVCGGGAFTGAIEGAGSVYLGPGRSDLVPSLGASLVVAGELHLRGTTRIEGVVALAHGITPLGAGQKRLVPIGSRGFVTARERVPGFRTSGAPRPGLLHPLDEVPCDDEEPLYLARPGR